jgi:hypothetical protein
LIDVVIADENLHAASSFDLIGLEFWQSKGATKASSFTLGARMYQTNVEMSTCRGRLDT